METMPSSEDLKNASNKQETLRRQFARLRKATHETMRAEEQQRLKDNPLPTEDELYMGAFREWLEPQMRDAIPIMYRKGYATESSGFHATRPQQQLADGYFEIDPQTKAVLNSMGVEVLRGPDIGLPNNKHITILRFSGTEPSIDVLKKKWDAIAAALPPTELPAAIRPICDRAEEFRLQFAPDYPSLEGARKAFHDYVDAKDY